MRHNGVAVVVLDDIDFRAYRQPNRAVPAELPAFRRQRLHRVFVRGSPTGAYIGFDLDHPGPGVGLPATDTALHQDNRGYAPRGDIANE